jgi:hypothetical protein
LKPQVKHHATNFGAVQAERLISDALVMTSPSGLHAEVRRRLSSIAEGVASGVRNEGLLASHVLQQRPRNPGWEKLCARSQLLLGDRSEALLTGLGGSVALADRSGGRLVG